MATKLDELVISLRADIRGLQSALSTATRDIKRFNSDASREISNFEKTVRRAQDALVTFGGAWATFRVGKNIYEAGVQVESLESKMLAAVQSSRDSQKAFAFLRSETDRLGLRFNSTADAFASFAASATRAGLSLDQVQDVFLGVSEASVAFRLSNERVQLVFQALSQMASKGVISMEELKGQLGESLPIAMDAAARGMGVTQAQLIKMVERGDVAAREFLPAFGKAIRENLGDSVEMASRSAQANLNRMMNEFEKLRAVSSSSGPLQGLSVAFSDLADAMKDPELQQAVRDISMLIGGLVLVAGKASAALLEMTGSAAAIPGMLVRGGLPPEAVDKSGLPPYPTKGQLSLPSGNFRTNNFEFLTESRIGGRRSDAADSLARQNDELRLQQEELKKLATAAEAARARSAEAIQSLRYDLMGDEGQAMEQLTARQKLIEEALENQAITQQQHRDLMLESEIAYQEELDRIRDAAAQREEQRQQQISELKVQMEHRALNSIHNLISLFANKNKAVALALLAFDKARAIAQATIETHVAAAAALKYDPTGALSAYVTKLGYANVAAIAATGLVEAAMLTRGGSGGGSGGSTSSSAGIAATTGVASASSASSKTVYLNLNSETGWFSKNDIRRLLDDIEDAIGDGSSRIILSS